jgi:hypothetical protein
LSIGSESLPASRGGVLVLRNYRSEIHAGHRLVGTTIPVPRIHYLAPRVHLLAERPLAELFIELAAGAGLHGVLERYVRLAPAADFIRALGGDRLPAPLAVIVLSIVRADRREPLVVPLKLATEIAVTAEQSRVLPYRQNTRVIGRG